MFVLQVFGHAFGLFGFNLLRRGAEGFVGFAIFWRATHVGSGVGEGNARFGHSDEFHGLLRGDRERQRFRIGQSDIFAREDHDASRDEAKVFAGMQHFCEPVDRAFFVGRAHALNECADRVVVRVADAIVDDRFLLNAFLRDFEIEIRYVVFVGDALCRVRRFLRCRGRDGPRPPGGVVRTPISSAFNALRASPSLTSARNSALHR